MAYKKYQKETKAEPKFQDSPGEIVDVITKWGGIKRIVVSVKTFKESKYLDIRLFLSETESTGMGVTFSFRDEGTEVIQLLNAIKTVVDVEGFSIPPVEVTEEYPF
jgi:hypothetical protein